MVPKVVIEWPSRYNFNPKATSLVLELGQACSFSGGAKWTSLE